MQTLWDNLKIRAANQKKVKDNFCKKGALVPGKFYLSRFRKI